ncbi:MAG: hypothetical protein R3194_06970, partial [Limnobacter sp.]|nr:hypothetical protein [Limnobacter sp.]
MSTESQATTNNPLLDFSGLPRFDAIQTEHVQPAIDHLLQQAKAQLEHTTSTPVQAISWDATAKPLD